MSSLGVYILESQSLPICDSAYLSTTSCSHHAGFLERGSNTKCAQSARKKN